MKVREVIEGFISDGDGMCWFTTMAYDSDSTQEVVSPVFDDIEWDGVSHMVS